MKIDLQAQAPLGSGAMFDRIAGKYDRVNRVLSLGLDRRWRKQLVRGVGDDVGLGDEILDVATGTADVAIEAATSLPGVHVVGVDPSPRMLDIGRQKVAASGLSARVTLLESSAASLPFEDGRFAAVTIAFGIRNVPDRLQALKEMARVLRPGGTLGVLELTEPQGGIHAQLARLWVHGAVPAIGGWISGDAEYRYLARSIAAFPAPEAFASMLRDAGLEAVASRPLTFGAVHLFTSIRSETPRRDPPR